MNYEHEINNLKAQVSNLSNAILQMARNNSSEVSAREDTTNGLKTTDKNVEQNSSDIEDNSLGLFDVAALADENSQAIMELAEMIADM